MQDIRPYFDSLPRVKCDVEQTKKRNPFFGLNIFIHTYIYILTYKHTSMYFTINV